MQNFVRHGVIDAKGGGKFWELSVVGASLILREGKIGDKGKVTKMDCADRPSAHAQAERLFLEKKSAGYLMLPLKLLPEANDNKLAADAMATSAVHAAAPDEWLALEKKFTGICGRINEKYREELTDMLGPRFKAGAWAWDPVVESRQHNDIDRLGDLVTGPLFTSEAYEWPWRDGMPMAPLIQLDLARASQIGSLPLGDGLLQLWMPHKALAGEDQYVRVVPRIAVDRKVLTPAPTLPPELSPLMDMDAQEQAYQIVGWGNKRYTTPLAQGMQSYYTLRQLTADPQLGEEIRAFDKELAEWVQGSSAPFSPANAHLFGTFAEVQYAPHESLQPLFCFDGSPFELLWGDCGNAQLFYAIGAEGAVSFTFDWSSL